MPSDGIVELDVSDPRSWLAECAGAYERVAGELDPAQRRDIERFLADPPPAPALAAGHVLCHNDLGAEHLLTGDHGILTGVIDWSDAARADLAVDLGRLARDLGPAVAAQIAARLELDEAALRRASFYARCTLIEDLEYGLTTGDRRYSRAAVAHLARTFRWEHP